MCSVFESAHISYSPWFVYYVLKLSYSLLNRVISIKLDFSCAIRLKGLKVSWGLIDSADRSIDLSPSLVPCACALAYYSERGMVNWNKVGETSYPKMLSWQFSRNKWKVNKQINKELEKCCLVYIYQSI